jgi:hypothetical protein
VWQVSYVLLAGQGVVRHPRRQASGWQETAGTGDGDDGAAGRRRTRHHRRAVREGKEVVRGYAEIEVADLDEALRKVQTWPGCPVVEVRPLES